MTALRITYLLEDTTLFGGVKVVLRQADLLHRLGHEVLVLTKGRPPDWTDVTAPLEHRPVFDREHLPESDLLVATYWTTIQPAVASGRGAVAHYCQGFEASYTHNESEHPEILQAYSLDLPTLCVSPHLERLVRDRFGRETRTVVQPLERFWRPSAESQREHHRPRILVPGPWEIDWKGVEDGVAACLWLRERRHQLDIIRLSQWPLSAEERAAHEPAEFHSHVRPEQAAEVVRSCDLALVGSWEQEGFGLPALEAMASGVPVVARDVSCYRSWAQGALELHAEYSDPDSLAVTIGGLLDDPERRQTLRSAGLRRAERYSELHAGQSAEAAMRWALELGRTRLTTL